MSKNEMTRKNALAIALRELSEDNRPEVEEACAVLGKMLAQLEKPKAPTVNKTAMANEATAREVADAVESGEVITCSWLVEHIGTVTTPQKAVAVMTKAIALGLFEKVTTDKKRTAYRRV